MSVPRTIIIGDVHGCRVELEQLLERCAYRPQDRLVFVGDLVNRGPDSHGVVRLARERESLCVLGNHEARLIRFHRLGESRLLKPYDAATVHVLADEDWAYLERLPLTLEFPELDVVVVHGGFLPSRPWRTQTVDVVTRIQIIDRRGQPAKRSDTPDGTPWADLWTGPPFVVYGHTPRPEVFRRQHSLGIDTGCVYGGHLTAYVLPDKEIVQVRARQAYAT